MGKRGESRSRSRSRSYSPSPSPPPRHRRSYDSRDRRRDRFRDRRLLSSTSLLVRNIARETRPEDLRIPFEKIGMVKDVYLPKNYYTGEPRGFGFVKYANPDDAAEAKHYMNHRVINGREISIVFAEENRKNPDEMRLKSIKRSRYGGGGYRRHTPPRSPRWRQSYSRSESPPYRSTSISRDRNSHPSNSRSDDSPPSINRSHDSLSPRGRSHDSPPDRRISRDSPLSRDRFCNSSPPRSKSYDSPPSRIRYHDSPPPRDGFHDSFSYRHMPSESSLRHRAHGSPARITSHVSTPFWGNPGDSSPPKSRPSHSNLFSIPEQVS